MLGIDVSKDALDVALVDVATRQVVLQKHVSNTSAGIETLLRCVPESVPWVVEPTGRFSVPVVERARRNGRRVLLAPPREAKRYIQSHSPRATTDRIAARGLAFFALDRPLSDYPLKAVDVDEIDQLLHARRGIHRSMTSLQQRLGELPRATECLAECVSALRAQLRKVDSQIERAVRTSPLVELVRRMQAVPGVGPISSSALGARLQSRNFARPDQWVAYCGMDVSIRQSGKRQGKRSLTKQGDAELRRLAYLCAQAAVRTKDSPFTAQFERECAKGMTKIAAYCAVARKLLTVLWAIQHHGVEYDPEMVYLPPWERRKRQQASPPVDSVAQAPAQETPAAQHTQDMSSPEPEARPSDIAIADAPSRPGAHSHNPHDTQSRTRSNSNHLPMH